MKRSATSNPLTERLAALSEVIRLRICRLLERHELSVGEVASVVQLPQSTVSRHLKVLSDAGWVQKRAEGTATLYRLVPDDLDAPHRSLWLTIREQLDDDVSVADDLRRVKSVLSERKTDSLSFFGRVAGEWDKVRGELFGEDFTARALLALLPRDWVVADLGCGTGNIAELLAPRVKQVVAVDQSGPMLEAAKKRLEGIGNVKFVAGPIEALPLESGSVDAAISALVLHHVAEPLDALREMRRVLKPGGRALVIDMFAHERSEYRHTMGHAHLGFDPESFAQEMTKAGFKRPRVDPLDCGTHARGPGLFVGSAEC